MSETSKGTFIGENRIKAHGNRLLLRALIAFFAMAAMLSSVAYAWLTANRQVGSGDMDMALVVDDTSASYVVYRYDIAEGKCVTTDADGNALNIANLDFNQYDTIFKSYNKYTPMIVKVDVVRISSMPTSGKLALTITKNKTGEYTDPECVSSKVMRFALAILDVGTTTDPSEVYAIFEEQLYHPLSAVGLNYSADYTKTLATATLVDGGDYNIESAENTVLYVDYDEGDWFFDDEGNQTLTAYLYIMYDAALVSLYQSDVEIGDGSLSANVVGFENDLKKISVGYIPADEN